MTIKQVNGLYIATISVNGKKQEFASRVSMLDAMLLAFRMVKI